MVKFKYTSMWQLGFFLKFSVSDYLLVCRFVPVLVLPRHSVATGSISPPSQHGRTVLWDSHVKTKIKTFSGFLRAWTISCVASQCLSSLVKALLTTEVTARRYHILSLALSICKYSTTPSVVKKLIKENCVEEKWNFREAKLYKEWFQERKTSSKVPSHPPQRLHVR